MSNIIIIDDDKEMLALLEDHLRLQGHDVQGFLSPIKALEKILSLEQSPDLILTDLQMPDMSGIEVTRRIKAQYPETPIIIMTAFGSIESAVQSMKKGAFDYITKPFKLSEINLILTRALEMSRLAKENALLRAELQKGLSTKKLVGKSKSMVNLIQLIEKVAPSNASVLITGESGTGKEVIARTLHQLSPRTDKPFVAINCTAIPETLLESELFGFSKGSFTGAERKKSGLFEEAHGGTLFLDEIGDMDLALQAKLLRVLQERKIRPIGETRDIDIDVRVIAATHKDLKKAIREGLFREDLYYRLNVIPIVIPPLRHRREDIPILAQNFLTKYAAINQSPARQFSPEALLLLMNRQWPGNVRELDNIVQRALIICDGDQINAADILLESAPTVMDNQPELSGVQSSEADVSLFKSEIYEQEHRIILETMRACANSRKEVAERLGISARTLRYKLARMRESGIQLPA